ncbi:MAG TPA: 3-oxoacyl-ACP synthase III [Gemmatales bacterium]|nr:3-oxoacyl-ACP synthase III [Gemmatales bacterium]HMP58559.1 3-oxoacyl-ACP synthase III [Gemmatales bacterium]
MRFSKVQVDALAYDLAPVVVATSELEQRLAPLYRHLRLGPGHLEALTGIQERRWWEEDFALSDGARNAALRALAQTSVRPADLGAVIYAGVCREQFEPATACRVAAQLHVGPDTAIYDISNACLGVLNGMIEIANRIELGQMRAGLVVSCESAREINDQTIARLNAEPSHELFRQSLATLTGGSGAVAVLLTDGSFGPARRRLVGGVIQAAPEFHALCRWGLETFETLVPRGLREFMVTDSVAVLRHGVALGLRTWASFLKRVGWMRDQIDKVICHQVGAGHRDAILETLGLRADQEFSSFPYLGNMGTVSLPLTAALAEESGFVQPGDRVGFLGIGSGLSCLMLGLEW